MATLDTLDSERHTYAEEISDERRKRIALQAQISVASAERARIEAERDGLREGVLHLIDKGVYARKSNDVLMSTPGLTRVDS